MDLIYMNNDKEDEGIVRDYTMDLEYGGNSDNDFECVVNIQNHICKDGYFLYYENTEYGGIVDDICVDTDADSITYKGRTWHGILNSKIIEPDTGQDYLVLNGEANQVIAGLLTRLGLGSLFKASTEDSKIGISNYQMNRYVGGYDGIRKMLQDNYAKLVIRFSRGTVTVSAVPIVDYSKDEQFDTDQIDFTVEKHYRQTNHLICLGTGDLKDRQVLHLYTDSHGVIGTTKVLTGIDEVTDIYDYPNAESLEELRQGGVEKLTEAWSADKIEFDFNSDAETYDIGDIVGSVERVTGIAVAADITRKIVTIKNNTTTISYKVGDK